MTLVILAAAACTTARLTSSWKAPDTGPLNFAGKKVVALIISDDGVMRREAEDSLARALTARGVQGVPASTLIPPAEARDREKAKARLQQAGVEGVVAMRVAGKNAELNYVPGGPFSTSMWNHPYYSSFWGYYGWGWGVVSSPGYLKTDTVVTVETLIYSLPKDKLLWAAMSETTNPTSVDSTIKALVNEAAKRLKYEGLIR
ncbi:MAG: hypothetical protein OEW18_09230 [Candidatus Aminicenantes bacterium]|nr:hypothetical protein [Candidatus Aminicenantes bacterium]